MLRTFHSSAIRASHVGSLPITIPPAVSLDLAPARILVTGPLGFQSISLPPAVILNPSPQTLHVSVSDATDKSQRCLWGLTRTLINNAIIGVSSGYTLELRLVGVGYRAAVESSRLNLKLGFAHPILVDIPSDITATTPVPTKIILAGTDKQRLGQFAAKIREWRKPEPYRGKGIFVGDETIRLKEVKKK